MEKNGFTRQAASCRALPWELREDVYNQPLCLNVAAGDEKMETQGPAGDAKTAGARVVEDVEAGLLQRV